MKIQINDICTLKTNDYVTLKVVNILPKGSHGRRCVLVECLASGGSTPPNFRGAGIWTVRMIDLVKIKTRMVYIDVDNERREVN